MNRGDFVKLTYNGKSVRAMVLLVSENERSVMLGFGDTLRSEDGGLFAGSMPVFKWADGQYRDLLKQGIATIEPEARGDTAPAE